MNILTCNIRIAKAADGANGWIHRRDLCARVISSCAPDLICFQEMQLDQLHDLSPRLPAYHAFGMAVSPQLPHPFNTIFYRPELFRVIGTGGYWLSEQPHVAGSKSWDSACGVNFRLINTHLDHIGQTAREEQARLLVEDAAAYPAEYAQILTGDLNCDASNAAIHRLKAGGWSDTFAAMHGTEDPGHTYHEFRGPRYAGKVGKMDWILTRGAVRTLAAAVVRDDEGGRFPSDHYFVSATVAL